MKFPDTERALKVVLDPLSHPDNVRVALVTRHLMHMLHNRRHSLKGAYYRERAHKDAAFLRTLASERESTIESHLDNKFENGT